MRGRPVAVAVAGSEGQPRDLLARVGDEVHLVDARAVLLLDKDSWLEKRIRSP
jgi:hypothetical protein